MVRTDGDFQADDSVTESGEQSDDIERIAANWVVRLGGHPLNDAERGELGAWLTADVSHRAAFDRANKVWSDLNVLKSNPGRLRSVIAPVKKPPITRRARVVLALLLPIAGGMGLYWTGNPWVALTADYRTGPGEIRTVRLVDGTIVDLGPSSALAVDFDQQARRVRLLEGEVYFTVAPIQGAEQRPFTAVAEGGTTKALGTQFAIEDTGESAVVTAVEHKVEVVPPEGAQDLSRVVLSPGDAVQYNGKSGLGVVHQTDVTLAMAWRHGMIVFNDMPLSEVIARLNRYRRGRIVLMNAALGNRRVSGVFPSNNLDNVVETISAELGAHAVSAPPLVTLLY